MNNGGSVVTKYELWRNQGFDGSSLVEVIGYSYLTNGFLVTLNAATESMTAGSFY